MTKKNETIALAIPMAPGKNILGQDRWWRNGHNDRTVWYRRITDAVAIAGLAPGQRYRIVTITVDWGRRKPALRQDGMDRIKAMIGSGLVRSHLVLAGTMGQVEVHQEWSGIGYGTTLVTLERQGDVGAGHHGANTPVRSGLGTGEELSAAVPDGHSAV